VATDALVLLRNADPLAMDALVRELAGERGFFWKRRFVRALTASASLPGFWSAEPRRWLGQGILATLEALAEDPDVGQQALTALSLLVREGVQSRTFEASLFRALHGTNADQRSAAKKAAMFAENSLRGMFERLLRDEDADLRGFAAAKLVGVFPFDRAWLDRANDPELSVRASLSYGLSRTDPDHWTDVERQALETFFADANEDVRDDAWRVLQSTRKSERMVTLPVAESFDGKPVEISRAQRALPVSPELLRSLVHSPERKVLAALAPGYPSPLCYELLDALAGDTEPDVVETVAAALQECAVAENPDAALAVASRLADNPALAHEDWLRMGEGPRRRSGRGRVRG
jgi:hypothetical protein